MPTPNATRIELALYVEPPYVDSIKELIDTSDDRRSLPLHVEKMIGALLQGEPFSDRDFGHAEYGVGIVEVYPEDES